MRARWNSLRDVLITCLLVPELLAKHWRTQPTNCCNWATKMGDNWSLKFDRPGSEFWDCSSLHYVLAEDAKMELANELRLDLSYLLDDENSGQPVSASATHQSSPTSRLHSTMSGLATSRCSYSRLVVIVSYWLHEFLIRPGCYFASDGSQVL